MGGHGGLNILPQKRWNVYNFDNRERVRKDEEAAARAEQVERQKTRHEELNSALEKLRGKSKKSKIEESGSGVDRIAGYEGDNVDTSEKRLGSVCEAERQQQQHVNLFVDYEERERCAHGQGEVTIGSDRKAAEPDKKGKHGERREQVQTREPPEENHGLGFGALGKNGKRPWYLTKTFMLERSRGGNAYDGGFSEGNEKHAKARKCLPSGKKPVKTVEEMRAERLKREQQERDKARSLVHAHAGRKAGSSAYNPEKPNQCSSSRSYYNSSFGNSR